MKLSPMERKLHGLLTREYLAVSELIERLYDGLNRPKSKNCVSAMISRMRKKGVQIENKRGCGYRLASSALVEITSKVSPSISQGGSIKQEIGGMMKRYGINMISFKDIIIRLVAAMNPSETLRLPAPERVELITFSTPFVSTGPIGPEVIDLIKNHDGSYGVAE